MIEIKWSNNETKDDGDTLVLSELSVLKSNAGYYLGYLCKTLLKSKKGEYIDYVEPYKRISGYFKTRKETEIALTKEN